MNSVAQYGNVAKTVIMAHHEVTFIIGKQERSISSPNVVCPIDQSKSNTSFAESILALSVQEEPGYLNPLRGFPIKENYDNKNETSWHA